MSCEGYPTASNMKLLATDAQTINEVVTSTADLTTPASDGLPKTTLTGIDNKVAEAISNSFSAYIGDWSIGLTFNAPNEYAVFNGVSYKPKSGTGLPYVAQGADPTLSPDVENVEPFSDINTGNIYANAGGKKNEIGNPQFVAATPDASVTPPSATPTNYLEGEQIFSGWFVDAGGVTNLTYVNGLVNADSGVVNYLVPNTGALESLNDFTASVAGLNLKPSVGGVSYTLDGDNYKVELDLSVASDVFSAKFEVGLIATGHEAWATKGINYTFNTVAEMVANGAPVGERVEWLGYYSASDGGSNWGIVRSGAHTEDGLSIFSIDANTYVEANLKGERVNVLKAGAHQNANARISLAYTYAADNEQRVKIPHIDGGYELSSTLSITTDTDCYGYFKSNGVIENTTLISIGSPRIRVKDISVSGALHDRNNGNNALVIPEGSFGVVLKRPKVDVFDIGLTINTFSIKVSSGEIIACNTNLSMWAPSASSEVNNININEGQYFGAIDYAAFVADDRFGAVTGITQGWGINFRGCDLENAPTRVGDAGNVSFDGTYHENPTSTISEASGKHIYCKGTLGLIRNVQAKNVHFVQGDYGMYCATDTYGASIEDSSFTDVKKCGLWDASSLGMSSFKRNTQITNSFIEGVPHHTGLAPGAGSDALGNYENDDVAARGSQFSIGIKPDSSLPGARYTDSGGGTYRNTSGSPWRTYKSPKTGILGTKSGTFIQLTTPSEIAGFNAGDAILINGSSSNIFQVNYDIGAFFVNFIGADGGVTLDQVLSVWTAE